MKSFCACSELQLQIQHNTLIFQFQYLRCTTVYKPCIELDVQDRQIDRQTDRHIDRQIESQKDNSTYILYRKTDRQKDMQVTQTDRQIEERLTKIMAVRQIECNIVHVDKSERFRQF